MAQLLLSKATLTREQVRLKTYRRFLPALDMKRQQIRLAYKDQELQVAELQGQISEIESLVAKTLPMVADPGFEIENLVKVIAFDTQPASLAGCQVQKIKTLTVEPTVNACVTRPYWISQLQLHLVKAVSLSIRLSIARQQARTLLSAQTKVTQRFNLFEKVLIPKAEKNIVRLRLHLADREREAVIRSKLAKRRHVPEI